MSTRIRLRRMGAKKRPFYRVVVADQRSPRDGRFIENIGLYHPLEDPSVIEIDEERALHWLRTGAQPSDQVRNLMSKLGIWEKFTAERPGAAGAVVKPQKPPKEKVSKKTRERAAAAAAAPPAEAAAETAPAVEPEPVAEPESAAPEASEPEAAAAEVAAPEEAQVAEDAAPEAEAQVAEDAPAPAEEAPEGA